MKYITKILGIACMALSFFACSEDSFEVFQPMQSADDVSYSINFSLQLQEPVTRSVVYGEDGGTPEVGVKSMQLLCFDASGLYLGIRPATLGSEGFEGTIKGTVPQGTARIHFVANRQLSPALDFPVGTLETDVMKSLSTEYDFPAIIYWGYKAFDTAEDMNNWLQGKNVTPENKIVYMIRDRAKIKLSLNDFDKIIEGCTVTEVKWKIHNGHTSGYLAPLTGWDQYTKVNTESKTVSNAKFSDNGSRRYSLLDFVDSDSEDDIAGYFEAYQNPQYLFDDDNEVSEDMKGVVKVILRVKYTEDNSSKLKYFVTLVKAIDETYIDITRNYTYTLHVTGLDLDLSYNTLEDAINGTFYANGDVDVSRDLTDINNDDYSLQIKLPTETTSIVFNMLTTESETNDNMQFAVIKVGDTAPNVDIKNIKVKWEHGSSDGATDGGIESYVQLQNPIVVSKGGGMFYIPVKVVQLPTNLQNDWLVVEYTANNRTLRRFIHVFVINQFKFLTNPVLSEVKNTEGKVTDYKLSFQIPPTTATNVGDPMYPTGLYPIDVMFATSTLKAWSINGTSEVYGSFGTSLESTSNFTDSRTELSYNLFNESGFETGYVKISTYDDGQNTNWWYQPYNASTKKGAWDFWYTYSIRNFEQTTPVRDAQNKVIGGEVNIFFKDVRSQLKYANVGNVGLYLYVRYFGKIYGMNVTTTTNNNP